MMIDHKVEMINENLDEITEPLDQGNGQIEEVFEIVSFRPNKGCK